MLLCLIRDRSTWVLIWEYDHACRWKQRDIHEKREARKQKIAQLQAQLAVHERIRPRIAELRDQVASQGPPIFSQTVDRLRSNPSPEKPSDAPDQPTYDAMVLDALVLVSEEVKKQDVDKDDIVKFGNALTDGLDKHLKEMDSYQEKAKAELETELNEQKKHITSDDLKEGWDSHVSSFPLTGSFE